jgi:CheY-like chemotaxis protein
VLVVEDEPDARDLVQRVLEEQGAEVHVAASAPEALAALSQRPVDVLVSDIGMPGMDGCEMMRQLGGGGAASAPVPAVALTAFARPEDREAALRAGFREYLPKPVDPAALVSVVARLAGRVTCT